MRVSLAEAIAFRWKDAIARNAAAQTIAENADDNVAYTARVHRRLQLRRSPPKRQHYLEAFGLCFCAAGMSLRLSSTALSAAACISGRCLVMIGWTTWVDSADMVGNSFRYF